MFASAKRLLALCSEELGMLAAEDVRAQLRATADFRSAAQARQGSGCFTEDSWPRLQQGV